MTALRSKYRSSSPFPASSHYFRDRDVDESIRRSGISNHHLQQKNLVLHALEVIQACQADSPEKLRLADDSLFEELRKQGLLHKLSYPPSISNDPRFANPFRNKEPLVEGIMRLPSEAFQQPPEGAGPIAFPSRGGEGILGGMAKIASDVYRRIAEPLDYFVLGHYRGAAVFSAAAVETTLREKYPKEKTFSDMIKRAKKDGLLEEADADELDSIRVARNSFVHELNVDVCKEEAEKIITAVISVLNKLILSKG